MGLLSLALVLRRCRSHGSDLEKAGRLASFGILWFFLVLAPTTVIPLADVIEEHRTYLASWGIIAALATAGAAASRRWSATKPRIRWAAGALAVCACAALAVALYQRNTVWESKLTLWRDTVEKSPGKARARNNLGNALLEKGDAAGAANEYWAAMRGDGSIPSTIVASNLGRALLALGRNDEAIAILNGALAGSPRDPGLLDGLANALLRRGDAPGAAELARAAIRYAPEDGGAHAYRSARVSLRSRRSARRRVVGGAPFRALWVGSFDALRVEPIPPLIRECRGDRRCRRDQSRRSPCTDGEITHRVYRLVEGAGHTGIADPGRHTDCSARFAVARPAQGERLPTGSRDEARSRSSGSHDRGGSRR